MPVCWVNAGSGFEVKQRRYTVDGAVPVECTGIKLVRVTDRILYLFPLRGMVFTERKVSFDIGYDILSGFDFTVLVQHFKRLVYSRAALCGIVKLKLGDISVYLAGHETCDF